MTRLIFLLSSISFTTLFISCNQDRNADDYTSEDYSIIQEELKLPQIVANYELDLKEHFLPPGKAYPKVNIVSLADKQANNNQATLGRVLFYDNNLSLDGNVSCGSCHQPDRAFSDEGKFSQGVGEVATTRNSLALATTLSFKISYNPIDPTLSRSKFSWDDSASSLGQQVKNAFRNENEMNIDDAEIKQRINSKSFYPILFEKAYGDQIVNSDRIAQAITAFVDAISSTNSKFDEGLEASPRFSVENNFYNFSAKENFGKQLFNNNCASCHTDKHNFTVKASANNGLELNYEDKGIGGRTSSPELMGVFKIPFLRNIGLTGPYMHDGRFETLMDVVDHYSDKIVDHRNLSPELKNEDGSARKMNFSPEEKVALVAYLNTLTDYTIASDDRFSNPFRE